MIYGTQIDEMSTNSIDRPFAPGDLQRSVEKNIGQYTQIALVCPQNHAQNCLFYGYRRFMREHKGSVAFYCKVGTLCTVKVVMLLTD